VYIEMYRTQELELKFKETPTIRLPTASWKASGDSQGLANNWKSQIVAREKWS
jgi:hypothetical protein